MSSCPCHELLTNSEKLEERLKPYEEYVDQLQAMLYFRNPIPMAILILLVNLIFFVIGTLHLSFLPTFFLLMTIRVLIKIVIKTVGPVIFGMFFRPIENRDDGNYPIYPLSTVCETIVFFCSRIFGIVGKAKPKGQVTIMNAAIPLASLAALFFLFLITGTFWFNFFLVNLILVLPIILLHPEVKKQIEPFLEKLEKVKVD